MEAENKDRETARARRRDLRRGSSSSSGRQTPSKQKVLLRRLTILLPQIRPGIQETLATTLQYQSIALMPFRLHSIVVALVVERWPVDVGSFITNLIGHSAVSSS